MALWDEDGCDAIVAFARCVSRAGRRAVKVEPHPMMLSTVTVPSIK